MGHTTTEKFGHATLRASYSPNKRKRWVAAVLEDGHELWSTPGFCSRSAAIEAARDWASENIDFHPQRVA